MPNVALAGMIHHTREDWGARAFPRAHTRVTHNVIEIHHDVYRRGLDFTPERHCRNIERDHYELGWNGPFYNLGLDWNGELWELRGVGNRSYANALCVVVFGNYEIDSPTSKTLATIGRLRGVLGADIDWHTKRQRRTGDGLASACPGRNLISVLPTIQPIPTPFGATPIGDPPPPTSDSEDDMRLNERKVLMKPVANKEDGWKNAVLVDLVDYTALPITSDKQGAFWKFALGQDRVALESPEVIGQFRRV